MWNTVHEPTLILLFLRLTNSGTQGVWVYKIGFSTFFNNIIPGRVTTIEENVFIPEATENPEPRFSGLGEITEEPPYKAETIPPEIRPLEAIPPEPAFPETLLEVKPVIQSQPTYNHHPSHGSNPHNVYPLPRGPRPGNQEVVVLEDQDEEINVNGNMLAVRNGKSR